MEHFDLNTTLWDFDPNGQNNAWTIGNAVEGVQIFGGIGSGKTSGSGRKLAFKYLKAGFGGLVLTVKPDEKESWQDYCKATGRESDLLILSPGSGYHFNFLEYELSHAAGESAMTENLVEVLKTVIRASEEKDNGKSDDAFWESALDMLIFNLIDLCKMAYGSLSLQTMYDIVQTIPTKTTVLTPRMKGRDEDPPDDSKEGQKTDDKRQAKQLRGTAFEKAMVNARTNMGNKVESWKATLTIEQLTAMLDPTVGFAMMQEEVPESRLFNMVYQFFLVSFRGLAEKTRSIIEFSFSGFLYRLLREPIYSLFCKGVPNILPQDSLDGKIILIDLPVKMYHKVGRDCQILFKYIWQRAMEKRNVKTNTRPVFLWADESQHFLHEHDASFQATARSSRVATVYLSQNLPNYYASMGGEKSDYRVKSFLGTLATKIFHANADIETNRYASELIGHGFNMVESRTTTMAGENMSASKTETAELESMVRPEEFVSLNTGGKANASIIRAYLHRQGKPFGNGQNFIKIKINQNQ